MGVSLAAARDVLLGLAQPGVHGASVADNCLLRNEWVCPAYVESRQAEILDALGQHVLITVMSVGIGALLAFPLALLARRSRVLRNVVLGASTVVYTIPSLALFSLLLGITGLSITTVVTGLVLYSLTVLVRNMVAGLDAVPDDVLDAARGMGFAPRRLLWKVQVPLALPAFFAGLRVATVSTVALTTIGFLVGFGGLGNLIRSGLTGFFKAEVLTAAVLCVVLAIAADLLILLAQRLSTPWVRGAQGVSGPLGDLLGYLTDGASWSGDGGLLVRTTEHLWISFLALLAAVLVAVPLSLWLGHIGRGGVLAINAGNAARAVPSYAVLVIFVLLPNPLGANTFSFVLALALFSLPPLLTNTYVGVREVDRDVVDAAKGVGMSGWQVLSRVELPLAMPLVMTGVRLAAVQVVATTTVIGLVGGGGLGRLINAGFANSDQGQVMGSALVVTVLALLTEGLFEVLERSVRRRRTTRPPSGRQVADTTLGEPAVPAGV